jgi:hypothetical protein
MSEGNMLTLLCPNRISQPYVLGNNIFMLNVSNGMPDEPAVPRCGHLRERFLKEKERTVPFRRNVPFFGTVRSFFFGTLLCS